MKLLMAVCLIAASMTATAHATTYLTDYQNVPPNQDHAILGSNSTFNGVLDHLVVNVTTSATSQVAIHDGPSTFGSDIVLVPNSTPIGVYTVNVGARSSLGAWRVRTFAGSSVFAVGSFK